MRGTHRQHVHADILERFIPAYAGNTANMDKKPHTAAVHPRVCGEHRTLMLWSVRKAGSSPRMRGTPRRLFPLVGIPRFIPAYAGNTEIPNN